MGEVLTERVRLRAAAPLVAVLLLVAPAASAGEGEPTLPERAYARALGELASPGVGAEVRRVERSDPSGRVAARGVLVEAPGLTVERLRFRSAEAAAAYARRARGAMVEARGDQVVVLDGPAVPADPGSAGLLRTAAWGTLPAPAAPPSVSRFTAPAPEPPAGLPRASRSPEPAPPPPSPSPGPREVPAGDVASSPGSPGPRAALAGPQQGVGDRLREAFGLAPAPDVPRAAPPRDPRKRLVAAVRGLGDDLSPHQRRRAVRAFVDLAPADQERVADVIGAADGQPAVQVQLLHALAASRPPAQIAWLAGQLDGRSPEWIATHTSLTVGEGVKQQFGMGCVPTSGQALRGEYDPVYALWTRRVNGDVHQADPDDPFSLNPTLAAEQLRVLEAHGGRASSRNAGAEGRGIPWMDMLPHLASTTGVLYRPVETWQRGDRAVALLEAHLSQGRVVPVTVSEPGLSLSHAILATDLRREPDGTTSFRMFDPWEGRSTWVAAADIVGDRLEFAGWSLLVHEVFVPSESVEPGTE